MINKYTTTVENIDKLRENKENKRQNIDVNYFLFNTKSHIIIIMILFVNNNNLIHKLLYNSMLILLKIINKRLQLFNL